MRLAAAIALMFVASASAAQAPPAAPAPTRFDAATIKPAPPPTGSMNRVMRMGTNFDPQRLTASNVTLKGLLQTAYDLKPYQVQGPDWINTERYDLSAETAAPATHDQMRVLLQDLLTRQFHLQLEHSTKITDIYAMVVAKGGLKIKPGELDTPNAATRMGGAPPPPAPGQPGKMPPGAFMIMMSSSALTLKGSASMAQLTSTLSNFVDRPIVDASGISGTYPINLMFAPTGTMKLMMVGPKGMMTASHGGAMAGSGAAAGKDDAQASAPAPTIFSALKQQLGLQLDPRRAPIAMLIVTAGDKTPAGN